MIYGLLSDVHANLPALAAVLDALERDGAEGLLFLGDAVGYGADANECVQLLTARALHAVRGNHDRIVASREEAGGYEYSHPDVRTADLWSRRSLRPANLALVRALAPGPLVFAEGIVLCHGSPRDEDEYIFDPLEAASCAAHLRRMHPDAVVCFHGHTHVAAVWDSSGRPVRESTLRLDGPGPWLVNPGSVGQPRDGDARAAYGVYDSRSRVYAARRVGYDIGEAQRTIVAGGLPRRFADRLCRGQ